AALGAADALDQAGPAEAQQDLLDVVGGQPLGVRQLAGSHGPVPGPAAPGQVERDDQAVFGPGGDPHEVNMRGRRSGFNAHTWGWRRLTPTSGRAGAARAVGRGPRLRRGMALPPVAAVRFEGRDRAATL